MYQARLFDDTELNHIVNVALVPQRSPFRYPGGKTWLIPRIRQWLLSKTKRPPLLVEPFVGGGIVSLTAGMEDLVEHVIMSELDDEVAAVWSTILNDEHGGEWLAERIVNFDLTFEAVEEVLTKSGDSIRDKAFRTILKNRVNRGGILAPGAGIVKNGENGKGLHSRWYPETLKRRILSIVEFKDRFTFVQGDGQKVMRQYAHHADAAFFIDPPYTAAGKKAGRRLYTHSELDHCELFRLAKGLSGDILMTYDCADELVELAKRQGFDTLLVAMKNTHHAKMNELLIGSNLDWAKTDANA